MGKSFPVGKVNEARSECAPSEFKALGVIMHTFSFDSYFVQKRSVYTYNFKPRSILWQDIVKMIK